MFGLMLCHSRDKHLRILMPAGSWQFPGTTVIHLDPLWVLEGLSQICNLVIANYIPDAFCLFPSPASQHLFLYNLGIKELPSSPPAPAPSCPTALGTRTRGGLPKGRQDGAGRLLPATTAVSLQLPFSCWRASVTPACWFPARRH